MFQHLIVALVFALCLYFVAQRIVRIVSRARKNEQRCETCTEASCPLRQTVKKCNTMRTPIRNKKCS
jgi:flagellar biogenesis protein FliO